MPAVRQDMVSPQAGEAEDLSDLQDHLLEHAKKGGQSSVMEAGRAKDEVAARGYEYQDGYAVAVKTMLSEKMAGKAVTKRMKASLAASKKRIA